MYDELLKPELQRKYVWKKHKLVDLLNNSTWFNNTINFLANTPDNYKLITDGYQRIMTVYFFVKK